MNTSDWADSYRITILPLLSFLGHKASIFVFPEDLFTITGDPMTVCLPWNTEPKLPR